ncbi:MAG TPA: formate/nitrite transporter family protein [Gemmatimonadaceae bacterium]|nr:formate/nitrite transporter family protein [Gemmatimonadaceae bacterium]
MAYTGDQQQQPPPPPVGDAAEAASETRERQRKDDEDARKRDEEKRKHEEEAARERTMNEYAERPSPDLTAEERRRAREAASLDARTTHRVIREAGEKELTRGASALAWSGIAAGLSMGLSMAAEGMLRARLPDAPWRPLVAKLGYSAGFLAVILGSQQLFTENTLTPVVPYLSKNSETKLSHVLRLWGIVLVANLVGTFLFALAASKTAVFPPELRGAFAAIGTETVVGPFWSTFARAVGAGWIVALMVWMLPDSKDARFWVIIVMAYIIGAANLSHIVAGSAEAFYVVLTGAVGWSAFFADFFLPTLLGNVVGGTTLVAALNHGQVEG